MADLLQDCDTMKRLKSWLSVIKSSHKERFKGTVTIINANLSNEDNKDKKEAIIHRIHAFIDGAYRWFTSDNTTSGYQLPSIITVIPEKYFLCETGKWKSLLRNKDPYRLSMMMGNPMQGTLHSILRHASQWQTVCPRVNQLFGELPEKVRELINNIERDMKTPIRACKLFFTHLATIALEEAEAVGDVLNPHSLFSEMEEEIYRFIVEHTSCELRSVVGGGLSPSGGLKTEVVEFRREGLLGIPLWESIHVGEIIAANDSEGLVAAQTWDLMLVVPDAHSDDLGTYAGKVHPIITAYFSDQPRQPQACPDWLLRYSCYSD